MKIVLFSGLAAIMLAGCVSPNVTQQDGRKADELVALAQVDALAVQNAPKALKAYECDKKYHVDGKLAAEELMPWVKCIKAAKLAYSDLPPDMAPIEPGSSISYDRNGYYYPIEMNLSNGATINGDDWENLKAILPKDRKVRDAVIDGLSRHWFEYDKFDKAIKVAPLRFISGPYAMHDHVALRGTIKNGKASGFLIQFQYYGNDWLFVERVKINVDGKNYSVGAVNVSRDNDTKVWETATAKLSQNNKNVARAIAEGKDVTIRFIGRQYYHDFTVPENMKSDLGAMLTAIEYL